MENRQYVTDLIGDEYLKWKTGDKVLISTPTGSGKSTFVIASLLKTAVENEKHIVYYCNRKVLNDQFTVQSQLKIKEAFGKEADVTETAAKHLHIFTYQSSELRMNYPKVVDVDDSTETKIILEPKDIMYYVFDEAHYFISDALINGGTNFWFNSKFDCGISVFLTATPKPLITFLAGRDWLSVEGSRVLYEEFRKEDKQKAALKKFEEMFLERMCREFKQVNVAPTLPAEGILAAEAIRRNRKALKTWHNALADEFACSKRITYHYSYKPDYSYIKEIFFEDYAQLLPEIEKSEDKWLIFVDNEDTGIVLENTFREKGFNVWFLSGPRIRRGGKHKKVYDYIVLTEELPTKILIATSALDCGINIKDSMVKNIVIANDNETTFLQMLGRKRIEPGEKVRLFIKRFDYLKIHNRFYKSIDKLRFSIKFSLKNELGLIKSGRSTYYRDGNSYGTYLSAHELRSLAMESLQHKDELLTVANLDYLEPDCMGHIKERKINGMNYDQIMREFEYSKTAFLHLMLRIYDYEKATEGYRTVQKNFSTLCEHFLLCIKRIQGIRSETDVEQALFYDMEITKDRFNKFHLEYVRKDEEIIDFESHAMGDNFFYLLHQLKWIGKEYSDNNWINYDEIFTELLRILSELAEIKYHLREFDEYHEQKEFSMRCLELMQALPVLPKVIAKDASRYGKGDKPLYPGINKLNKCFESLEIPFRIESRQVKFKDIKKRKTCWYIVKIEEQNEL